MRIQMLNIQMHLHLLTSRVYGVAKLLGGYPIDVSFILRQIWGRSEFYIVAYVMGTALPPGAVLPQVIVYLEDKIEWNCCHHRGVNHRGVNQTEDHVVFIPSTLTRHVT